MTKKEIIEKLVNECGYENKKEELNQMAVSELRKLLKECEEKEPETREVEAENKPSDQDKQEEKELDTFIRQLGIYTEYIYHVKNPGAKVRVENIGYGDAYVNDVPVKVGEMGHRIVTGKSREFVGATKLYMVAASQPTLKITEIG